jgi:hypothetical protein
VRFPGFRNRVGKKAISNWQLAISQFAYEVGRDAGFRETRANG